LYLKWLSGVLLGLLVLLLIFICGLILLFKVLWHGAISLSPPGKWNALYPVQSGSLVHRAVSNYSNLGKTGSKQAVCVRAVEAYNKRN
jgi:hypothetical protein